MKITQEYQELNRELHHTNHNYGAKGWKRWPFVWGEFIVPYELKTVLDYGCGKGTLSKKLKLEKDFDITNYDPCYAMYDNYPTGKTFDGVICNDVLEHVEPELLDNVIQDLYSLGTKAFYFEVGLTPSNKKLADGRNNHLTVEPSSWWIERFKKNGFKLEKVLADFIDPHDPLHGMFAGVYTKYANHSNG